MGKSIEYYRSGERGKFKFLGGGGALLIAYLSTSAAIPVPNMGVAPAFVLVVAGLAVLADWVYGNFTPFLRLEKDRLVYSPGLYGSDQEYPRVRLSDIEFRARESLIGRVRTCQIRMDGIDNLEFPANLLTERDQRTFENRVLNWARREQ
ncbi:MAG: hypothetical protein ABEL76_14255 [Bradymonadaceae bacterium]